MARLSMRCTDELVAAVDVARGDVPREVWLRRAVERALGDDRQREGIPPVVADLPAPAEQPVGVEQRPATGVGGGSPGVSKASLPAAAEQPVDRVAAFRRATQR